MTENHSQQKKSSKISEKEPLLNSILAKDESGKRLFSKIFLISLVAIGVLIGSVLQHRQGNSYKTQLDDALSAMTNVEQGKVGVSTTRSGIDAEVETIFVAKPGKPQQTLTRLDYLRSAEDESDDVKLLDIFKSPYAELPLADERLWVTVKTDKDIDSLESLGFPVGTLMNENANTPLLPFGNFNQSERTQINSAITNAFRNAEFIRVQDGLMEFQANVSEDDAVAIARSTEETAEPMDQNATGKLYKDGDSVSVTAKVDRESDRLVELKLVTEIDGEELIAVYDFSYDEVELPSSQPKSITAESFVNRYLKKIKSNN